MWSIWSDALLPSVPDDVWSGSLTFDCTTSRDCDALAWVMRHGAKQPVIAEYCHSRLTSEQQVFEI
jgi:hypothetical protein